MAMNIVADLRLGRPPQAALTAAASVFLPITLVSWITWKVIEGDRGTLLESQFSQWTSMTISAAALTCVAAAVFWRSRNVRVGAVLGLLLAAAALACGLFIDLVGSGGLA